MIWEIEGDLISQVLLPQDLLPIDPAGYKPEAPGVCHKRWQQKNTELSFWPFKLFESGTNAELIQKINAAQ